MASDLIKSMKISAAGMKTQGIRLRVVSENLANAQSTAANPGANPYRRKVVSFKNALDRELGVETVRLRKITTDKSPFTIRYEPGHPAADDQKLTFTASCTCRGGPACVYCPKSDRGLLGYAPVPNTLLMSV